MNQNMTSIRMMRSGDIATKNDLKRAIDPPILDGTLKSLNMQSSERMVNPAFASTWVIGENMAVM
jgi:hypothetical protein